MEKTCPVCGITFIDLKHPYKMFCSRQCSSASRKLPTSVCMYCGKEFKGGKDGNGSQSKFCSRNCYDNYRTESRPKCAYCGKRIKASRSKTARFCSHECRVLFKKPQPRPCVNCGAIFTPVKMHNKMKRFIAHDSGKTCSAKCQNERNRNNSERKRKIGAAFTGARHPNWQGGKTALNVSTHRGSQWLKIAEEVRLRDNHVCQKCGKTQEENGRKLDVHHIKAYHDVNDSAKSNRKANLISLCKSCHRKEDNKIKHKQIILPFAVIAREARHARIQASP